MWQLALKVATTAVVVVAVAEIGRRNTLWAAALASLPLTSMLALIWLYLDTRDVERVATLSQSIFWLVLPSLLLLAALPWLLRAGWGFWTSLIIACALTSAVYVLAIRLLTYFGVHL